MPEMKKLLDVFPEPFHPIIMEVSLAQTFFAQERQELKDSRDVDMAEKQAPQFARSRCSDSRTPPPAAASSGAGSTLLHAVPGAFLTEPGGDLSESGEQFIELAGAYKVPVVEVNQHSGCGAMKIIYTYHMADGGENYVAEHYGNGFAKMAKSKANLVQRVAKKGTSYYEAMGMPLLGNDEARFETSMAIQQGLWDLKAIQEEKKKNDRLPAPILTFTHLHEIQRYVFHPEKGMFLSVPETQLPARIPARPVAGGGCNCGKGDGCCSKKTIEPIPA